jgi:hypothetical protein
MQELIKETFYDIVGEPVYRHPCEIEFLEVFFVYFFFYSFSWGSVQIRSHLSIYINLSSKVIGLLSTILT